MGNTKTIFACLLFIAAPLWARAQSTPTFSQIVVFGDSLSDDGNVAHRARDTVLFSYPSSNFNYSDYRFTNDFNTDPPTRLYKGTWHEQLARDFLQLSDQSNKVNSLDGGTDYAFGGATTQNGSQDRTIVSNPTPFGGGKYTLTIDNVGKQITDYLSSHTPDATTLYVVWGGGNDLFDDDSSTNVTATATRVGALVTRLANFGARNFMVPNVPPLGAVPNSFGDPQKVAELDLASANYRSALNSVLASTTSSLAANGISIQIYTLDVWLGLIRVLGEPGKYGFNDTTDPAQGDSSENPDKSLFWDDIHPTTAGHHEIANEAYRLLSGQVAPTARAVNISTRGVAGTGEQVLIGGFIIGGSAPKKVMVRGLGPSLTDRGVSGALADPTLTIFDGNNMPVETNDNWKSSQQTEIEASGLAPEKDLESAIIITLPPGAYSAIVSGVDSTTGVALAEVFDLDSAAETSFANLSARGFVGTGDNVLIGGLIIASGESALTVLRAIGPSLSNSGITQPLLDPVLELHDANGALLITNDDWNDSTPTAVKATNLQPTDQHESAIVVSLAPGGYSAIVRGKNSTTGVALLEAFRIE